MKLKIAVIVVLVLSGLGFMIVSSTESVAQPHYQLVEFEEILNKSPKKLEGKFLTLYGTVKEGSIRRNGAKANFVIEQNGIEMPVYFTGKTLLPDMFKDGTDTSLDGAYNAQEKIFVADKALAKCGSKYEGKIQYQKNQL